MTKLLARIALLAALFARRRHDGVCAAPVGRIVGTVFDPQRAGIPGATVTVTNVATNIARTAVTDSQGNYVITPLDPGTYNVSARCPASRRRCGRADAHRRTGRPESSSQLNLGGLSTEVQVTAETPLLNTESATLSEVITNEQIVDLPLNGRGFHELARLTSGVALLPPTGNTQPVRPEVVNGNVIGGVAGSQTRFLLDGVDITEEHQGGTWIQTSVDALQEFSVQQNAYSAEFHGAGATFNVTTKSGGNAFHGSLFEFMRNDAFDSKNFFAVNKEKLERNQFGGTLGGPVMIPGLYDGRNKTFFFASYEGHRRQQGVVDVSIVPSAAQRQGDFSGLAPIFDPLTTATVAGVATRTQFANNQIPANRISPQAQFFMQYIPLPNAPGNTYVSNPITSFNAEPDDAAARSGDQLAAQVLRALQQSRECGRPAGSMGDARVDAARGTGVQRWRMSLTSNFGSSLVHEVRFSRMYGEYRSTAYFQGQGVDLVQQQAGVKGLERHPGSEHRQSAGIHYLGYQGFSGNAGDGRPKWQDRGEYELIDSLTWIKGKHILKFGGRMYHRNILFTDARSHNGAFSYTGVMTQRPVTSAGTGVSFADFLLGYPASVTRSNPATWWGGTGTYWHGFFQDDYRLTNNLTVNLGLRYEYTPWLTALPEPGSGVRSDAREVDHRLERDRSDRSRRAGAGGCRVSAVRRSDSDQQSGRRSAPADEERHEPMGASRRVRVSPWRSHGRSRRLRHVLRSRRHERAAELPLPAVQHERNRERHDQRRAEPHDRRLTFSACRSARRSERGLESADARCGFRIRPALELRRSAGNRQPHEPRSELRRNQGHESAGSRADQYSARQVLATFRPAGRIRDSAT